MKPQIALRTFVTDNVFKEFPVSPMSIYFADSAEMIKQYPYLRAKYLYILTDYWQNPRGEIMIKFLELDHYVRFTPGGVVLSNFIVQN